MKTILLLILLLPSLFSTSSFAEDQERDNSLLENFKNVESEYESEKETIFSQLKFWRRKKDIQDTPDDASTIKLQTDQGDMTLTVDLLKRHVDNHIDRDHNMIHFRTAINDILLKLSPIIKVETFYTMNKSRMGDEDGAFEAELGRQIWWMVNQMYRNEDDLKKDVVILMSNADFIKNPNFKLGQFYFGHKYDKTEEMIYFVKDPRVENVNQEYRELRDVVVGKANEIEDLVKLLDETFQAFYDVHQKILSTYNEKIMRAEKMTEIEAETLAQLNQLFEQRAKIVDTTQMILRESLTFDNKKDDLKKIFEKAELIVSGVNSKLEGDGFNDEEYFEKRYEESKQRAIENKVKTELENGQIEMSDIKDVDLASKLLKDGVSVNIEEKKGVLREGVVLIAFVCGLWVM